MKHGKHSSHMVKTGTKKFKTDFGLPSGPSPQRGTKVPYVRVSVQSTLVKQMANHIVIILHGIEVDPTEVAWSEELAWRLNLYSGGSLECHARKYGYVSGKRAWLNWGYFSTGRSYRDAIVDHEEVYFEKLKALRGTDAKVSVICHSLGGYIIHKLLERGLKFHRIIELYGAGDENQDWSAIENNFDRIYVWYSQNDEVLPKSNFGKIGLIGPINRHPKVHRIRTKDEHTTFMEDTEMYARLSLWKEQLEG